MEMRSAKVKFCSVVRVLLLLVVNFNLLQWAHCVDGDDYSQTGNPALLPIITDSLYNRLSNLSTVFSDSILESSDFCIKNVKADWDEAFDFTGRLDFLTNCIRKTKGDITRRLCTAAEINFYFSSLYGNDQTAVNYLKPNKNCNLSFWPSGCEPGWGCSTPPKEKVVLENTKTMPERAEDCQPCCEGFFCPKALTCMIPCPLGSYCPLAKLNQSTGMCDPYNYQIPPGQLNHTCGSADTWADVANSRIFCPPGSYCPSPILKNPCTSGHYCLMGSTAETSCYKLTSCKPNTANQNLQAYGIILIIVLTTLLLIIVNCSDQVLSVRERRAAKSREAAARQARETAQARERWKNATAVAKKGAMGLQQQLSRKFSRQRSKSQTDALLPSTPPLPTTSTAPPPPSTAKNKEPSNLTRIVESIESNPNQHEGFHFEIGDKNIKKSLPPKGKQLHTNSQIFKYAYGQIEKEKAMAQEHKNLTFSGVISMATDTDIKTRPVIEIAFKDLTLTLKGKNKHLLRSITGKFTPGRVSAVMGPSGAGKTTFLSALAGKVSGCTMRGSILINGKNESIHSYKKIIGFVPQDDIVHGDLTVEENLLFSARCRLCADMPKADKVLVIERVIESLGLQAVRDSLVGTVEKRGISGGQRKRVNVGLEMVMEPSLLILDEPTTGLDSASSTLLLKALRREALEGVNISAVIHQPSYALFKMFDELILLAKGGFTVYHGSTKKVEEYFSSFGIDVPEHVTPPDHYIDILEGIVKPDSPVSYEQLPVKWMLHKGYPVPPDLLHLCEGLETPTNTEQPFTDPPRPLNTDLLMNAADLSNRRTPGVGRQYRYFLGRVVKQRLREAKLVAADYVILLLAGACLGTLSNVDDETFGSNGYTFTVIAISLLCKIAALRSFSLDKLHYWRESAAGISSLAYFLSKDTVDHFNTFIKPMFYLSMFYFFNSPRSSFMDNYVVLLCLVYCVTGIAYIFAIYLDPSPAQLGSVLFPVVLTLIATQEQQSGFVKVLGNLCYPKWAIEALIIANAERYSGVWVITRCHSLMNSGYNLGHWNLCLELLILTGIMSRFVAYFLLVTFQKK